MIKKTASKKCPICVALSPERVQVIDAALEPILEVVRETGEIPKVADHRLQSLSHSLQTAPHSLQYHLKTCLYSRDVYDQLRVEVKDMVSALSTAKSQYGQDPTFPNAQALALITESLIKLLKQSAGKQDPELHVDFVASAILSPVVRGSLMAASEEIRRLRDAVTRLAPEQATNINALADAAMQRYSSGIKTLMDAGLTKIVEFYKVEIDAKTRLRAMETSGVTEKLVTRKAAAQLGE